MDSRKMVMRKTCIAMLLLSSPISTSGLSRDGIQDEEGHFNLDSKRPQVMHYGGINAGSMMAQVTKFKSSEVDEIQRRLVASSLDPILPPYDNVYEQLVLKAKRIDGRSGESKFVELDGKEPVAEEEDEQIIQAMENVSAKMDVVDENDDENGDEEQLESGNSSSEDVETNSDADVSEKETIENPEVKSAEPIVKSEESDKVDNDDGKVQASETVSAEVDAENNVKEKEVELSTDSPEDEDVGIDSNKDESEDEATKEPQDELINKSEEAVEDDVGEEQIITNQEDKIGENLVSNEVVSESRKGDGDIDKPNEEPADEPKVIPEQTRNNDQDSDDEKIREDEESSSDAPGETETEAELTSETVSDEDLEITEEAKSVPTINDEGDVNAELHADGNDSEDDTEGISVPSEDEKVESDVDSLNLDQSQDGNASNTDDDELVVENESSSGESIGSISTDAVDDDSTKNEFLSNPDSDSEAVDSEADKHAGAVEEGSALGDESEIVEEQQDDTVNDSQSNNDVEEVISADEPQTSDEILTSEDETADSAEESLKKASEDSNGVIPEDAADESSDSTSDENAEEATDQLPAGDDILTIDSSEKEETLDGIISETSTVVPEEESSSSIEDVEAVAAEELETSTPIEDDTESEAENGADADDRADEEKNHEETLDAFPKESEVDPTNDAETKKDETIPDGHDDGTAAKTEVRPITEPDDTYMDLDEEPYAEAKYLETEPVPEAGIIAEVQEGTNVEAASTDSNPSDDGQSINVEKTGGDDNTESAEQAKDSDSSADSGDVTEATIPDQVNEETSIPNEPGSVNWKSSASEADDTPTEEIANEIPVSETDESFIDEVAGENSVDNHDDNDDGDEEEDPNESQTNQVDTTKSEPSPNEEFVRGLDDLHKFLENVDPPDELDVGASGLSIQEVLLGQGVEIIKNRVERGVNRVQRSLQTLKVKGVEKWDRVKGILDDQFAVNVDEVATSIVDKMEKPMKNIKKVTSKVMNVVDKVVSKTTTIFTNLGILEPDDDDDDLSFDGFQIGDEELAEMRRQLMERYSS